MYHRLRRQTGQRTIEKTTVGTVMAVSGFERQFVTDLSESGLENN